jgi:glycine/D-amino acid oxidase-like deaminating enzyme
MAPRPDPVVSDETFPERAGVVVIGGGIIGACTALELAERGIDVVLCEKGEVAPSSRAATGAGAARWAGTRARSRSPSKRCACGAA